MRKLVKFLKKFRDFLIFFALQVFVLTLFFQSKTYHRSKMTNTSSGVIGWFVEKKYNITKHFELEAANQKLMEENAKLRAQVPQSFYPLQGDLFEVDHTLKKQQYQYIPATVINSSQNSNNNFITINQGSTQGIEIGMGVISAEGVVGKVMDVSQHYALIMSVLSDNIRVNVKLEKNNEYWMLNWNGLDNELAQIDNVQPDIDVKPGDKVVTRGSTGAFPEGIAVGEVAEIIADNGAQTKSLNIDLAVNYNAVYHVYVVKNLMKDELNELEGRVNYNE